MTLLSAILAGAAFAATTALINAGVLSFRLYRSRRAVKRALADLELAVGKAVSIPCQCDFCKATRAAEAKTARPS